MSTFKYKCGKCKGYIPRYVRPIMGRGGRDNKYMRMFCSYSCSSGTGKRTSSLVEDARRFSK